MRPLLAFLGFALFVLTIAALFPRPTYDVVAVAMLGFWLRQAPNRFALAGIATVGSVLLFLQAWLSLPSGVDVSIALTTLFSMVLFSLLQDPLSPIKLHPTEQTAVDRTRQRLQDRLHTLTPALREMLDEDPAMAHGSVTYTIVVHKTTLTGLPVFSAKVQRHTFPVGTSVAQVDARAHRLCRIGKRIEQALATTARRSPGARLLPWLTAGSFSMTFTLSPESAHARLARLTAAAVGRVCDTPRPAAGD